MKDRPVLPKVNVANDPSSLKSAAALVDKAIELAKKFNSSDEDKLKIKEIVLDELNKLKKDVEEIKNLKKDLEIEEKKIEEEINLDEMIKIKNEKLEKLNAIKKNINNFITYLEAKKDKLGKKGILDYFTDDIAGFKTPIENLLNNIQKELNINAERLENKVEVLNNQITELENALEEENKLLLVDIQNRVVTINTLKKELYQEPMPFEIPDQMAGNKLAYNKFLKNKNEELRNEIDMLKKEKCLRIEIEKEGIGLNRSFLTMDIENQWKKYFTFTSLDGHSAEYSAPNPNSSNFDRYNDFVKKVKNFAEFRSEVKGIQSALKDCLSELEKNMDNDTEKVEIKRNIQDLTARTTRLFDSINFEKINDEKIVSIKEEIKNINASLVTVKQKIDDLKKPKKDANKVVLKNSNKKEESLDGEVIKEIKVEIEKYIRRLEKQNNIFYSLFFKNTQKKIKAANELYEHFENYPKMGQEEVESRLKIISEHRNRLFKPVEESTGGILAKKIETKLGMGKAA